jgi:hypothetical protein
MPLPTKWVFGVIAFTAGLSVGWIRLMMLRRAGHRRVSVGQIASGAILSLLPFAAILVALLVLNRTRESQLVVGLAGFAGLSLSRLITLRRT